MALISNIFTLRVTASDNINPFIHDYSLGNIAAKTVGYYDSTDTYTLVSNSLSGAVSLGVLPVGTIIEINYLFDDSFSSGQIFGHTSAVNCFLKSAGTINKVDLSSYPRMQCFTTNGNGTSMYGFHLSKFNYGGCINTIYSGNIAGSIFDFSNITDFGSQALYWFNNSGALTTLPNGGFQFNRNLPFSAGGEFMRGFNKGGSLQYLPDNSFNFENFITPQWGCFAEFNSDGGALGTTVIGNPNVPALPSGSFQFPPNPNFGASFSFYRFNYNGRLKYVPYGSFNWVLSSALYTAGTEALQDFNTNGGLQWSNDPNSCIQFQNFTDRVISIQLVDGGTQSVPSLGFVNILFDPYTNLSTNKKGNGGVGGIIIG